MSVNELKIGMLINGDQIIGYFEKENGEYLVDNFIFLKSINTEKGVILKPYVFPTKSKTISIESSKFLLNPDDPLPEVIDIYYELVKNGLKTISFLNPKDQQNPDQK